MNVPETVPLSISECIIAQFEFDPLLWIHLNRVSYTTDSASHRTDRIFNSERSEIRPFIFLIFWPTQGSSRFLLIDNYARLSQHLLRLYVVSAFPSKGKGGRYLVSIVANVNLALEKEISRDIDISTGIQNVVPDQPSIGSRTVISKASTGSR